MIKAFDKSLHVLRSAGALVIENTDFPAAKEFINNSLLSAQIMGGDFVVNMEKYLKQLVYNPHHITTCAGGLNKARWRDIRTNPPNSGTQRYKTGTTRNMVSDVLTSKAYTTVTKVAYWEQSSGITSMLLFYHLISPGTGLRLSVRLLCPFPSEPCRLASPSYPTPMD